MAIKLIVSIPFANYGKGAEITDQAEIDRALATNENHVVKVTVPDVPPVTKPAVIANS